jgi:hypothetical protein
MDNGACTTAWVRRTPCVAEGGRSCDVRGRWQLRWKGPAKEFPAQKYFLVTEPAYPGDQKPCYLETERMRQRVLRREVEWQI